VLVVREGLEGQSGLERLAPRVIQRDPNTSAHQTITQSIINQSINQSIHQSINQRSVNKSVNRQILIYYRYITTICCSNNLEQTSTGFAKHRH